MFLLKRLVLALLLALVGADVALARDEPSLPAAAQTPAAVVAPAAPAASAPVADAGLVAFASDEGLLRLARSTAKAGFAALANQFEPQSNAAFCGPTSATIVLNAVGGGGAALPRDRSRLRVQDLQHLPAGADLSLPRYTQDTVIEQGAKTRAQVLGEPVTIAGRQVRDFGYQTRQFDEMLRANGLRTRLVIVDDRMPEAQVRADLADHLARSGGFVVVTYRRQAVGQAGGGHISPLGAYDRESDSFLVLDVNPTSAGWVWMPTATLVRGMRTFDTLENRGYVLIDGR